MITENSNNLDKIIPSQLVCPDCHVSLGRHADSLKCPTCQRRYPVTGDIPDFRTIDSYWCNVGRDKMKALNKMAQETGDWLTSARRLIPEYLPHFVPFHRADSQFLWPTTERSRILDAGCMWGGITIPAAQFHHEVYAVDNTMETLNFLVTRANQMGLNNIFPVASSLASLPFPENFFDLVILSGVLEWVAVDEEIVLEKQWGGNWTGLHLKQKKRYPENPNAMQIKVLKEINRILKPGGSLFLAIENRIGYIYLAGWPDDHMNLPFICFMPRFLANAITKIFLNCEYRTYVYSVPGYRSLFKKAGFSGTEFYGAYQHYINPTHIIPFDRIEYLKREISLNTRRRPRFLLNLVPAKILKYLSPSIIALSTKDFSKPMHEPRIKRLFQKTGIIDTKCRDFGILKCKSRPGNDHTANFMIYTDVLRIPSYYCKICRNKHSTDILRDEAKNLKTIRSMVEQTEIIRAIPELVYFGTVDGITFLVTKFLQARRSRFDFNARLSKGNLKILDRDIRRALNFLTRFQKYTTKESVNASSYLGEVVEKRKKLLEKNGFADKESTNAVAKLIAEIHRLGSARIPICAVHGDFDFFHNIMFGRNGIHVFDFEHFCANGLPFYDLITLLIHPLLLSYEHQLKQVPFTTLLKNQVIMNYIKKWLVIYSEISGIPLEILRLAAAIVAVEQRTKDFPAYRDPHNFPIHSKNVFKDMLTLRINFSPRSYN